MLRESSSCEASRLAGAVAGRGVIRTQKELARLAGVTPVTVFNALHRPDKVKPETRERINQLMREHDYHPNGVARAMVNGKTGMIGIIVPELEVAYYAKFIAAVEQALHAADYHCLICQHHDDPLAEEREIQVMREYQVDGIVLRNCGLETDVNALRRLAHSGTPFVLWDGRAEGFDDFYVGGADRADAALAVKYLLDGHRRRVGYVGWHRSGDFRQSERYLGYQDALRAAGLEPAPAVETQCQTEYSSGREETLALLRRNRGATPDAIFAFNDHCALGVLRGLKEAGLQVPRDVAVMGFGGYLDQALLPLALSTVVQDIAGLANQAARLLLSQQAGGQPGQGPFRLHGALRIGQST